jgi:ketosteroid isomerase-like protein
MSINIDNTRKAYAAFASGDIATLSELIAPDCIWHVNGRNPLAGTYTGHEQILTYFGKLAEETEGTFKAELVDLGELSGGMVTCLVTLTGSRKGATIKERSIQLARNNAAGQVAECWWFAEDPYAADAFFSDQEIVLPGQQKAKATTKV